CLNGNTTATSTIVSIGQNTWVDCYCTPIYSTGCSSYNLNSVKLAGEGTTSINDLNTGCNNTTATGYSDRRAIVPTVDLKQDKEYEIQLNTTSTSTLVYGSVWIDFNDNGTYENTEQLLSDKILGNNPG